MISDTLLKFVRFFDSEVNIRTLVLVFCIETHYIRNIFGQMIKTHTSTEMVILQRLPLSTSADMKVIPNFAFELL